MTQTVREKINEYPVGAAGAVVLLVVALLEALAAFGAPIAESQITALEAVAVAGAAVWAHRRVSPVPKDQRGLTGQ